jgi:hypothetical protein
VKGNLGMGFPDKGLMTKNGLRHEEKIDWFPYCLENYGNYPDYNSTLWNTFIEIEEIVFSCWLLSCRKGNIIMNMYARISR